MQINRLESIPLDSGTLFTCGVGTNNLYHILSWTHTSTRTHLSTGHTLSRSKKARIQTQHAQQLAILQMRSRLLVEAPTRHPSSSVTEALPSISFSLQFDTTIVMGMSTRAQVEVWVHNSKSLSEMNTVITVCGIGCLYQRHT